MEIGAQTQDEPLGEGGFPGLVSRYHALVCAVAFGATGDRALSEDIAQDTFVVAWRGRSTLRDPSRVRPWLCAIARHLALNARRRRAPEPLVDDERLIADVDLHAGLEGAQRDALVWQAIAAIPEPYRLVLVLYYREDKSIGEVARALGISEANALQRLSRGRRQLQRGIEDLVDRSLASSKPDRSRREAVIAALAADLADVPADAALEAARVSVESVSSKVVMMKVAVATVGVVGVVTLTHWGCAAVSDREPSGGEPPVVRADRERGGEPSALDRVAQTEPAHTSIGGDGDAAGRVASHAHEMPSALPGYRLSIIDAHQVAVNLEGGPSELMGANEAFGIELSGRVPDPQRSVSGRVVDASGAPVEGAVVIGGRMLTMQLDTSVTARAGDETDARGRFDINVDAAAPCTLLALHRDGWSAIERIEAGRTAETIELEIAAPARVHGAGRRGGAAQDGAVVVSDAGRNLRWKYPTDAEGRFSVLVPRGELTLGFRPGDVQGVGDPLVRTQVELRAGEVHAWNPDVALGTRLAVDVPLPSEGDLAMIWVGVMPGRDAPADATAMRARAKADERVRLRGFGGEDLGEVFEFEDLPAGGYVVCAQAEPRGRGAQPSIAFACRELEVKAGEELHELSLTW